MKGKTSENLFDGDGVGDWFEPIQLDGTASTLDPDGVGQPRPIGFVGKTPSGGIIRHRDPRGLPRTGRKIAAVRRKNERMADRARRVLRVLRGLS